MDRARIVGLALASIFLLSSFGMAEANGFGIQTFVGSPNPHVRGLNCVGCHWPNPPINRDPRSPQEPCGQCHLPATAQEQYQAAHCEQATCPVIINYWQQDGESLPFFMGLFRH